MLKTVIMLEDQSVANVTPRQRGTTEIQLRGKQCNFREKKTPKYQYKMNIQTPEQGERP